MTAVRSTEEVISATAGRTVVRVDRGDRKPLIIRRIDDSAPGAVDLVDRLSALKLIEGRRIPALAPVHRARLFGRTLETTEVGVDGFSLAEPRAHAEVTVNVALALFHDLAQGLAELHATVEGDGRPAHLIHGSVGLDRIMINAQGQVRLVGVEGLRGAPSIDAKALMEALRGLLDRRTQTPEGRLLLERLRTLSFAATDTILRAMKQYLGRQDPARLRTRRYEFNSAVRQSLGLSPALVPQDEARGFGAPLPTPLTPLTDARTAGAYPAWDSQAPELEEVPTGLVDVDGFVGSESATQLESYSIYSEDDDEAETQAGQVVAMTLREVPSLEIGAPSPPAPPPPDPTSVPLSDGLVVVKKRSTSPKPRRPSGDAPPNVIEFGSYRVVASIGRGGMGEIYLARKGGGPKPGPLVALKILASAANDAEFDDALAMLMDEAAIMARIENPHVLKVIDFGKADGRYYLATEYLEGRPLVRVMIEAYAKENGLDYGDIATIGADAALGLYAAHTANTVDGAPLRVIHRDVSPQNIFVTYDGVTKVIDFGVARASERVSRTEVGLVKGKAAYMSPEQAEGGPLDGRSDVFGLGVCLWEMTAGRRLFKRKQEYATLVAVQSAEIPPPTQVRGAPNPVLDHIILSALHRDQNQRTPSAQALAAQLMEFADHALGPDRRRRVRELLHRLFGDVASEERALIRRLEASATASGGDAEALQSLSGVSAQGTLRELTVVGRPASLNELEHFGAAGRAGKHAPTTAEWVIQAVAKARAAAGFAADPTREIPVTAGPSTTGSAGVAPARADVAAPQRGVSRPGGVDIGHLDEHRAPGGDDGFVLLDPRPKRSAAANRAAAPPRRRRWVVAALLLVGLGVVGGSAAVGVWLFAETDRGPPAASEPRSQSAPVEAESVAPVRILLPMDAEPVVHPDVEAPAIGRTDLETLVGAARARGLEITESRGTLVFDDRRGGTITVDGTAAVVRVDAPGAAGWLVETKARSLAAVAWVGRVKSSPWFVRSLSVNDCRASLRVDPSGLGLRYGREEVRLPHGGGLLLDVALPRPAFAERLEVEPLGLSFGREDSTQPHLHCRTGWWGQRVVLRRLPPGRYSLRWVGGAMSQTATMELSADSAVGADLVRSVQIP